MNTLSIKISDDLQSQLERASELEHLSKSDLVRKAISAYVARPAGGRGFVSALAQAGDLVGCFEGGPRDLASNPKYLAGFGKT